MDPNFKDRIYTNYLSARNQPIAPKAIEGLNLRRPYFQNLITHHFPKNRNSVILDLGCGHGCLIHFAHQTGYYNIRGVDFSQQQVTAAKNLCIDGIKHGEAMETLSKEPIASVDCIISFDLIEHFTRNELLPLIDAVYMTLKPGGRWIIHTPNAESPFGMRMRYWDITHELAFTRTSLSQILLSSGFSLVNCYEDRPVPHGIKSTIRWFLWKIIRSLLFSYIAVETGDTDRDAVFSQNFLAVAIK